MPCLSLESQSKILNTERAARYCGTAKVPSTSLVFYPNFTHAAGSAHPGKVERLKQIFKKEGCDRENTSHQIPGNITETVLSAALGRSHLNRDGLQNRANPPRLFLPQGSFIRCTHGSSRVRALEELNIPDKWWTIELYVDLSSDALEMISEDFDNASHHPDGHIYAKICRYRRIDQIRENRWWARLSKSKQGILRRLLNNGQLGPAYSDVLLNIPGMQDGLQIGTLPEIMAARCPERIVCYIRHIIYTWTHIMGSEDRLDYVDTEAVQEFQLRAPGMSQIDDEHITSVVRGDKVFKRLADRAEREEILQRARQIRGLIPSIYTLQQDFKYLRQCIGVLRRLIVGEGIVAWTIEESSFQAFSTQSYDAQSLQRNFCTNIRLLNLHIMRELVELSGENPLLDDDEVKMEPRAYDGRAWKNLADEARRLGFESEEISRALSMDPDRAEAERALLNARKPMMFEYDASEFEDLVTHVTNAFNNARTRQFEKHEAEMTCSTKGEPIARRCGRQYARSYNKDRYYLTHECFTHDMRKNADITSLFVRRSAYYAFWGDHDTASMVSMPLATESAMEDVTPDNTRSRNRDSDVDIGDAPAPAELCPVDAILQQRRQKRKQKKKKKKRSKQPHDPGSGVQPEDVTMAVVPAQQLPVDMEQDRPDSSTSQLAIEDQKDMSVFLHVNGEWKLTKRCRRSSVQKHTQEILEGHLERNWFLYRSDGRGIVLEDCHGLDNGIVGIGPHGVKGFPIEEQL